MIFFLCEILFLFLWDKEYGCSLFFWTDLFGTLSLLLDIDVINDAIQEAFSGINEEKIDNKTLTLVRFSKGIRAFRIIRLVKMAKIFARKSKLNEKKDEPQSDDKTEGNEDKLSEKFEDLTYIVVEDCVVIKSQGYEMLSVLKNNIKVFIDELKRIGDAI